MSLKGKLKSNAKFMSLYYKLLPTYCVLFPKAAIKLLYKQTYQKKLDLKNPRDLNEKINWLKAYVYPKDPLVIQCADKWRMREYVKDCGLEEILNEVYFAFDSADQIKWDQLPERFALKFNRAAGMNIICADKNKLDEKKTIETVRKWFTAECGERTCELHYRKAKPKIICERYLGGDNGEWPVDYKVHCLNGEPVCTMICTDRQNDLKFVFVDNEYVQIPCNTAVHGGGTLTPKPDLFERMLEVSKILSKPFPLVRLDYYVVGGKLYIGEMTFTPQGGYIDFINQEWLNKFGDMLILPERK